MLRCCSPLTVVGGARRVISRQNRFAVLLGSFIECPPLSDTAAGISCRKGTKGGSEMSRGLLPAALAIKLSVVAVLSFWADSMQDFFSLSFRRRWPLALWNERCHSLLLLLLFILRNGIFALECRISLKAESRWSDPRTPPSGYAFVTGQLSTSSDPEGTA